MNRTALSLTAFVFVLPLPGQEAEVAKPEPVAKQQPIPFSHKVHAKYMPRCGFCHRVSVPDGEISLPSEGKCMQCHEAVAVKSPAIQTLAEHFREKKSIPWVQIYELPDYVYFTHAAHATKSKIACETCHGPVAERDVITREKPISMVACMDCHRSSGAPLKCNTCHNANP
jgi:hypothetical protein